MRSAWVWWNVVSLNFKVRGLMSLMNSRTNLGTRLLARSAAHSAVTKIKMRGWLLCACYGSEKTGAPGENTVHSASSDRTSRALRSPSRISAPKSATCLRPALGPPLLLRYLSIARTSHASMPLRVYSVVREGAGCSRRSGGVGGSEWPVGTHAHSQGGSTQSMRTEKRGRKSLTSDTEL